MIRIRATQAHAQTPQDLLQCPDSSNSAGLLGDRIVRTLPVKGASGSKSESNASQADIADTIDPDNLTTKEAAAQLVVSVEHLSRLARTGRIRSYQIAEGNRRYYRPTDLDIYKAKRQAASYRVGENSRIERTNSTDSQVAADRFKRHGRWRHR